MSSCYTQLPLGQLELTENKLYGRRSHIMKLMSVCQGIGINDQSKIILISGYSGEGKSVVVKYVKQMLKATGVYFISGKFDQLQQAGPLPAINAALAEYCDHIVSKGSQNILDTRKAITKEINNDIGVLTAVFPCLHKIIGESAANPVE
eukprot:8068196-Ditylum_brightwellii.AAC.1